jgi:hypothetical protein
MLADVAAATRARRLGTLSDDIAPLPEFDGFLPAHSAERPAPAPERRVFALLATLASLAIGVAVALSWVLPSGRTLFGDQVATASGATATAARAAKLPKDPKAMLPDFIISYETIDRHAAPGTRGMAAEAIYQTYDMNTTAITHTIVYARVEGYATEAAAASALTALQARYPAGRKDIALQSGILAGSGYDAQSSELVVSWRSGRYVTYVKTSFTDNGTASAAKSQEVLTRIGDPIYRTVAIFQTRGLQGVEANRVLFGKGAPSNTPSSSLGPVDAGADVQ